MKFFLALVVTLTVVAACSGYSFLIPPKINLPGICMYNGLRLKPGDNSISSACQNMHCNADGSILVEGCGHYDRRDCRTLDPMHLDKPYPDCCKMNFLCQGVGDQPVHIEISPLQRRVYA